MYFLWRKDRHQKGTQEGWNIRVNLNRLLQIDAIFMHVCQEKFIKFIDKWNKNIEYIFTVLYFKKK
jgi:hypothetical protein